MTVNSTCQTIVEFLTPLRCLAVIIFPSHGAEALTVVFWSNWISTILAFIIMITCCAFPIINFTVFPREKLFACTSTISICSSWWTIVLTYSSIRSSCARNSLITVWSLPTICASATTVSKVTCHGSMHTSLTIGSGSTRDWVFTMGALIALGA